MYAMQQLQSWKAAQDKGALKVPLLAEVGVGPNWDQAH
jgi:DNA polymerase I-like protein with 3'-5' exonuclease and polymerase domains